MSRPILLCQRQDRRLCNIKVDSRVHLKLHSDNNPVFPLYKSVSVPHIILNFDFKKEPDLLLQKHYTTEVR